MKRIYLDNAATTPLAPEVVDAMVPLLKDTFGNPSSVHGYGREAKSVVEKARKDIAQMLNVSPLEIYFTSGGTEADNLAIRGLVQANKLTHAISSPLEHHAVLHTLQALANEGIVKLSMVNHDANGIIDLDHLRELLKANPRSLVSLMHANNEIGNVNDLAAIGTLCREFDAFFHSDTVQTMGHFPMDLRTLEVDALVGAAHKFHGPKGVGFMYLRKNTPLHTCLTGGSQERGTRGGTENLYGIAGMAKALELSLQHQEAHKAHIIDLKARLIAGLKQNFPEIYFHGCSESISQSLYTVLNVGFPPAEVNDMLLFHLDLHQIAASGGSACSSGSSVGSHVLAALGVPRSRGVVRFSFSRYNQPEEIDALIAALQEIYTAQKV